MRQILKFLCVHWDIKIFRKMLLASGVILLLYCGFKNVIQKDCDQGYPMKFNVVAKAFEEIQHVSSRIEMTKILAHLLKQATPKEAYIISNLALGTLRPAYEGMQFNIAEKKMLEIVRDLTQVSSDKIAQLERELGDLGSIIQSLDHWKKDTHNLSVEQVYGQLVALEDISGIGSVEVRANHLMALLKKMDALSAKYIVRIILGTLRLGFSDMTLIDALSWMEVGSKTLRPPLEHAYNICADLGLIAQTLKAEGIAGIEKMHIQLGVPIRPASAERLPTPEEIFEKLGPCIAQQKLDGFRIQLHLDKSDKAHPKIKLFSRNLIDITHMLPDLTKAILDLDVKEIIAEGEAIVFDQETNHFLPFQETVKRKRKHGIEQIISEFPLQLHLFDLLYVDGKSLLSVKESARFDQLVKVVKRSSAVADVIKVIEQEEINSAKQLETYFEHCIDLGLEGIVVKRTDAPYQAGKRNSNWIKLKRMEGALEDTVDCVILGYYHGAGKRVHFGIGAFLIGIYDRNKDAFETIARVGTGLTDAQWKDMKQQLDHIAVDHKPINVTCSKELYPDVWVAPEKVCVILADEITVSPAHTAGFALRFPRFVDYRPDKSAYQVTDIKEIKQLYKDQYKKNK